LAIVMENAPELDRYQRILVRRVRKAKGFVEEGRDFFAGGSVRPANTRLRRAMRHLIGVGYRIDSLVARRIVDGALREDLRTRVAELKLDLGQLIRVVTGRVR
jgi:hypothetical protein